MGLVAMLLQMQALKNGYDAKGLYVWNSPAQMALLLICGLFAVALITMTMQWGREMRKYRNLFPPCWFRSGAMALAGVMLLLDIFYSMEPVTPVMWVLGVLAAVCMAAGGILLSTGYRPHYVIHGIVCVYFLVRLLTSYRVWGASIHLERYAFLMLADALMMLYSFHRCAADAGIYARKRMLLTGFGAIFCSLVAMADYTDQVFYMTAVIWIIGSMCSLGGRNQVPNR